MNKLISVIMSAYNAELYIREAINSVLNQTYDCFEFLITDDMSTDNTLSIIQSYTDSRIIIISNETRRGLTYNLSKMIEIAKGEYIARIDADDICRIDRFEKQIQLLEQNKTNTVICSYASAIGEREGVIKIPKDGETIKALLLFYNPIVHSSVMFRKEGINYDPGIKKSQDYDLWDRIVANNGRFAVVDEPLVFLRYHQNQITKKNGLEQIEYSDMIRMRALQRIGIVLDENQRFRYLSWLNSNKISTLEDYNTCKTILERITKSPYLKAYYNKQSLLRVTKNRLYKLVIASIDNHINIPNRTKLLLKTMDFISLKIIVHRILFGRSVK